MKFNHFSSVHTSALALRRRVTGLIFMSLVLASLGGCGGHAGGAGNEDQYMSRKVAEEDIEKVLKFDARVEDFETDGDKLIVNVKQSWVSSPPGIQEFSLGQWFRQWQVSHGGQNGQPQKGVEVIVRYEGNDFARATADRGIEFLGKGSQKENGES